MASEKKSDYTHYVEDHKGGVDFLNTTTNRYLVTSIQQLKDIFEENKDKKYMSLDLETNDLDPSKETSFIVGYSFSFNGKDGYYVPVKHENPPYLGNESLDLLYQVCLNLDRVFLFNVMFDFNWLEFAGYDMSVVPYYDLMVGFFLADTNVPFPSLKQCEVKYLGWNMKRSFEEALGDNWNFYYTDAQTVVDYPALDAISTYQLAPISLKYYKESKLSGKIDNEVLYPLMRFMREGIRHDVPYIKHIMEEQDQRLKELEKEIYELVGYEFKISSPKQLSDALLACGIDTGVRTKTGYMKGGIDELEAVYKTNPNPVLKVLVEYKSLVKAHGSYSKPLYEYTSATPDSRLRYCYHAFRAPTGRLACGKDGKNTYYAKINEQSIPKPKYKQWYVHPYKEGDKVYPSDRVVLDWRFSLEEESDYYIEGLDPHWNLRNTFLPEEDSYWVSIDYSTQELKLMANYSDCKMWKEAFLNHGDLHHDTAVAMWGEENYCKDLRTKAKGCYDVNSMIATPNGLVKANTLNINSIVSDINGNAQVITNLEIEKKDGYIITFKNGLKTKVTQDHLFKLGNDFIKASDLKEGDILFFNGMKSFNTKYHIYDIKDKYTLRNFSTNLDTIYLDEDLAYLIGLYLGDGSLEFKYREFCDKKVATCFQVLVHNSYYDRVYNILNKYGNPIVTQEGKGWRVLRVSNTSFASFIHDFCGHTKSKFINDDFYTSPKSVMMSLVAGLMDSDGKCSFKNYIFCNASESLIRDVAFLFNSLDMQTRCYLCYTNYNGQRYPYYELKVLNPNRDIPNNKPTCINSLESFNGEIKGKFKRTNEGFPSEIINIEVHEIQAFIAETETHLIIGDNITSHNCNFGLIYGMSPYTMVHNFGISLEEAEDMYNKFWGAVPEIANYQKRCIAEARRTGTIYNYFGRPRRVKSYFSSPDRKKQSFGERTVRNTVIQSSGADITKTALIKIWRQLCSNPKYKDSIRFLSTIHDEINVSINYKDRELFDEILHKFYDIMYTKIKGWEVPFDVGLEIGIAWGDSFPFEYDQETRQYKPDMHKVEKKAKPKEEPKPQTQVIDDILDFNMDLD